MLKLSDASAPSCVRPGAQTRDLGLDTPHRILTDGVHVGAMPRYICIALACMGTSLGAFAEGLPEGGRLKHGLVSKQEDGNNMVLQQSSQTAIVEWSGFSIAEDHAVVVHQPLSSSVLLNRVMGPDISVIAGTLRATGSVLLINPNGVHITETGRIAASGFLASSIDIDDEDVPLNATEIHDRHNRRMLNSHIARKGAASAVGGVLSEGLIQVADGGFVSLAGTRTVHDGMITAQGGHVAISGPGYLNVSGRIDLDRQPAQKALPEGPLSPFSPQSPQSPQSPGGPQRAAGIMQDQIKQADLRYFQDPLASPGSPNARLANSARPLGSLTLIGSDIEISMRDPSPEANVDLTSVVHAETLAGALRDGHVAINSVGTWQTKVPAGGAEAGALPWTLPSEPIALQAALQKAGWQPGGIEIASPLNWSARTSLKLASTGSIRFNAPVTASGKDAMVSLHPAVGHEVKFADGRLSMMGETARFALNGRPYRLIRDADELQHAIREGGTQDYAIARNLNLRGVAMSPITLPTSPRGYHINGLGHRIEGLVIDSKSPAGVGLFSVLRGRSTISDLHLVQPDIKGVGETGAFVGAMHDHSRLIGVSVKGGHIRSAALAGTGPLASIGGIVGAMQGESAIRHAQLRNVTVRGMDNVGGVAGGMSADAHIADVVFSGTTHGRDRVGGIVGIQQGGTVERTTRRGDINGRHDVGGIAGYVGTGALITETLSDAVVVGTGRSGGIAGHVAFGSRHRMVGNVSPKDADHFGEHYGAYLNGAYVSPRPRERPAGSSSLAPAMPDHIFQLNPRPWDGKGCH